MTAQISGAYNNKDLILTHTTYQLFDCIAWQFSTGLLHFLHVLQQALTELSFQECMANNLDRQRYASPPEKMAGLFNVQYNEGNIFL